MEKLTENEIHRIHTFFESLGANHLEIYEKLKDELPILDNLIRVAINRCVDIDEEVLSLKTKISDLTKEVINIKACLDTLIKKWY